MLSRLTCLDPPLRGDDGRLHTIVIPAEAEISADALPKLWRTTIHQTAI